MGWLEDLIGYKDIRNSLGSLLPRRKMIRFLNGSVVDNPSMDSTDVSFGATSLHGSQVMSDGLHGMITRAYTDATARSAAALTAADLGHGALQISDGSVWIVTFNTGTGQYVWGQICTGPAAGTTPLTLMAGHIVSGHVPETGLTSVSWADIGPNSYHLSGTCTVQTNQINGYSCAKGNGTSNLLSRAQALPAPGTTPLYRYTVVRIDTYLNNLTISAFGAFNEHAVLMHSAGDQVSQFSAGSYRNINAGGCTVGSFKLIRTLNSNSAADSIQAGGGAAVTGTSALNATPTGIYLLGSNGAFSSVSIAEDWIFDAAPGAALTALLAYFATKFPGCTT